MDYNIKFNAPFFIGDEIEYISQAINQEKQLSGNGLFTKKCQDWITNKVGSKDTLLTNSCTAALEISAILIDAAPGDEIIMPSYTFVSTANAFVLHGAKPVFVDIDKDTLNIDPKKIEAAITDKTKAIVPVHYAGYPCDMNSIMSIARKHNLYVIEDAAQALLSSYHGKKLGSIGDLGCFSFHETKNIISGEGGSLCINNKKLIDRAHIIWEKGTNRRQFSEGVVDKYSWVDKGSSFLPSELVAAFLYAQLEKSELINSRRQSLYNKYLAHLSILKEKGLVDLPKEKEENIERNHHIFYMILESRDKRDKLIKYLKQNSILSVFHYIPLHSSPAGRKFGRVSGKMTYTDDLSSRIIRLPLHYNLSDSDIEKISALVINYFKS